MYDLKKRGSWFGDSQSFLYLKETNTFYIVNEQEYYIIEVDDPAQHKMLYHCTYPYSVTRNVIKWLISIDGGRFVYYRNVDYYMAIQSFEQHYSIELPKDFIFEVDKQRIYNQGIGEPYEQILRQKMIKFLISKDFTENEAAQHMKYVSTKGLEDYILSGSIEIPFVWLPTNLKKTYKPGIPYKLGPSLLNLLNEFFVDSEKELEDFKVYIILFLSNDCQIDYKYAKKYVAQLTLRDIQNIVLDGILYY